MEIPSLGETIGRSVRTLRASRGWSQAQLSEALGPAGLRWGRSQVGELESGGRDDIPVSALLLLAEVFNVPLTELVTGGGMVRLGATERPLDLVARMLRGEPPLDPGLVGPSEIPGMDPAVHGRGPYWVRTAGRASYVYSAMEVRAARLLDIFVEDVHEASQARWGRIIDLELARHVDEKDPEPRRQQVEQQLIDELASSPELMQRLRARAQGR